jgi:small-conductance mechanosensitive channel
MNQLSSVFSALGDAFTLNGFLTAARIADIARGLIVMLVAVMVAPLLRRGIVSVLGSRWTTQQVAICRRAVTYIVYGVAGLTALREAGFRLDFLLGSAGVVAFAVTYSSQKSLSQVITGIFIIIEQPFVLGDTITVAGITGEVLSIDLLSIKLRTADNLFVRVPSEMLLSGPVTNASHYTIRRLDIELGVSYREDISRVSRVLYAVADKNPLVLEEPKPLFSFSGYGESALKMQFCVWGRRESFLDMKNSMYEGIKKAFDAQGIEMPYPHTALVVGAGRESLAVAVRNGESEAEKKTSEG